jgi:hypothetical protein
MLVLDFFKNLFRDLTNTVLSVVWNVPVYSDALAVILSILRICLSFENVLIGVGLLAHVRRVRVHMCI